MVIIDIQGTCKLYKVHVNSAFFSLKSLMYNGSGDTEDLNNKLLVDFYSLYA